MRRPLESAQYTSIDSTQTLDDHLVLGSIGTVGDAYDNALAESFVDSYKTELIADRVWRSQAQLELETVKWVAWFNHDRLHSSLGDIPPVEFEHHHAAAIAPDPSISLNGSVAAISPKPANGLTTRRLATVGVDFVAPAQVASSSAPLAPSGVRSGRANSRATHQAQRVASPICGPGTYSLIEHFNYQQNDDPSHVTQSPSNSEDIARRLAWGLTYRQTDPSGVLLGPVGPWAGRRYRPYGRSGRAAVTS